MGEDGAGRELAEEGAVEGADVCGRRGRHVVRWMSFPVEFGWEWLTLELEAEAGEVEVSLKATVGIWVAAFSAMTVRF